MQLWAGVDQRELPRYGIKESAYYLGIPKATLVSWVEGRYYPLKLGGRKFFAPLIDLRGSSLLSFYNLVEAHILKSMRKLYALHMPEIRNAIDYVGKKFPSAHPLVTEQFYTDGKDLLVKKLELTIDASSGGQLGLRSILDLYLRRIERDRFGLPIQLFPFRVGWKEEPGREPPRIVVIDPDVSSGRPVVYGTGVMTLILSGRYEAGENIKDLAKDYGLNKHRIEEAIHYFEAAA
jgi:uncharacterized protein (DUF433 family)